jgi:hypothetical protein
MKPNEKGNTVLYISDEDVCVGGSCHRQSTIFEGRFVPSSRANFKFLQSKKEAKEAFDDKIN